MHLFQKTGVSHHKGKDNLFKTTQVGLPLKIIASDTYCQNFEVHSANEAFLYVPFRYTPATQIACSVMRSSKKCKLSRNNGKAKLANR